FGYKGFTVLYVIKVYSSVHNSCKCRPMYRCMNGHLISVEPIFGTAHKTWIKTLFRSLTNQIYMYSKTCVQRTPLEPQNVFTIFRCSLQRGNFIENSVSGVCAEKMYSLVTGVH
ncbi:unnamed protein product, partial [Owenia fusiformis]